MAQPGRTDGATQGPASSGGGYKPSLGFKIGIVGLIFFTGMLIVAGFVGTSQEPGTEAATVGGTTTPIPTVQISYGPRKTTPPDDYVRVATQGPTPAVAGIAVTPSAGASTPTPVERTASPRQVSAAPTATSTQAPPTPAVGEAASVTPTIGDDWTATPAPTTPATSTSLTTAATDLADQIEYRHGVRILRESQDWGDDQAEQLRNLTSIATALESVPSSVRQAIASNSGGKLTFISNHHGRTEGGWQPYGDRAANYYTNEDQGQDGDRAANAIVLQPGSNAQTVVHEMMHAYQMRGVAPGQYVQALLSDEMQSFMAATGWTQLVSDDVLRANATQSWDVIDSMFQYNGRSLGYLNEYGNISVLYTPNPIEAFAEAGGLYYAHSSATETPDWPEYWAWFSANVG